MFNSDLAKGKTFIAEVLGGYPPQSYHFGATGVGNAQNIGGTSVTPQVEQLFKIYIRDTANAPGVVRIEKDGGGIINQNEVLEIRANTQNTFDLIDQDGTAGNIYNTRITLDPSIDDGDGNANTIQGLDLIDRLSLFQLSTSGIGLTVPSGQGTVSVAGQTNPSSAHVSFASSFAGTANFKLAFYNSLAHNKLFKVDLLGPTASQCVKVRNCGAVVHSFKILVGGEQTALARINDENGYPLPGGFTPVKTDAATTFKYQRNDGTESNRYVLRIKTNTGAADPAAINAIGIPSGIHVVRGTTHLAAILNESRDLALDFSNAALNNKLFYAELLGPYANGAEYTLANGVGALSTPPQQEFGFNVGVEATPYREYQAGFVDGITGDRLIPLGTTLEMTYSTNKLFKFIASEPGGNAYALRVRLDPSVEDSDGDDNTIQGLTAAQQQEVLKVVEDDSEGLRIDNPCCDGRPQYTSTSGTIYGTAAVFTGNSQSNSNQYTLAFNHRHAAGRTFIAEFVGPYANIPAAKAKYDSANEPVRRSFKIKVKGVPPIRLVTNDNKYISEGDTFYLSKDTRTGIHDVCGFNNADLRPFYSFRMSFLAPADDDRYNFLRFILEDDEASAAQRHSRMTEFLVKPGRFCWRSEGQAGVGVTNLLNEPTNPKYGYVSQGFARTHSGVNQFSILMKDTHFPVGTKVKVELIRSIIHFAPSHSTRELQSINTYNARGALTGTGSWGGTTPGGKVIKTFTLITGPKPTTDPDDEEEDTIRKISSASFCWGAAGQGCRNPQNRQARTTDRLYATFNFKERKSVSEDLTLSYAVNPGGLTGITDNFLKTITVPANVRSVTVQLSSGNLVGTILGRRLEVIIDGEHQATFQVPSGFSSQ